MVSLVAHLHLVRAIQHGVQGKGERGPCIERISSRHPAWNERRSLVVFGDDQELCTVVCT